MQARWLRSAALMLSGLLMAVGCAPAQSPSPTGAQSSPNVSPPIGGPATTDASVTILVQTFDTERFDPFKMGGPAPYGLAVHAMLIDGNESGELTPGIASSWQISSDGLTWTFTIRDDVSFQDGVPLTVDDVVFSLTDTFGPAAIEQSTTSAIVALAKNTESVKATGPNTVEVRHLTPVPGFATIVSALDGNWGGVIFPKAYFERVGRDGYNRAPIGAGPFKVVEIKSGESMTMERFDGYYNKEQMPQFKTLKWNLVPELATRVQALRGGQADLITADITQQGQIEQGGGSVIFQREAAYVRGDLAGCWKPEFPCSDQRVRQALDLSLDKNLIMGQLYGGSWTNVGWGPVSPSGLGYSSDLDPTPFDPAGAQRLLAEAGYPGGEGFPTQIIYTFADAASAPRTPELALLIAQQWQTVLGITTEVRVGDPATLRVAFQNRELDGGLYLAANNARLDASGIANSAWGNIESLTRLHEEAALFAAVQDAAKVIDPDAREAAYIELYRKLKGTGYAFGLGYLGLVWGAGPRISGWHPWPVTSKVTSFWTIVVSG